LNSPAGSAPGWSLSRNASGTQPALGNISPFYNAFFDETEPAWGSNATRLLDTPRTVQTHVRARDKTPARGFVLNPATINDASTSPRSCRMRSTGPTVSRRSSTPSGR